MQKKNGKRDVARRANQLGTRRRRRRRGETPSPPSLMVLLAGGMGGWGEARGRFVLGLVIRVGTNDYFPPPGFVLLTR